MENFTLLISEVFEMDQSEVQMTDNFRDYDEWSSLSQLTLIALVNENYGVVISKQDLDKFETVQDIFDFINNK